MSDFVSGRLTLQHNDQYLEASTGSRYFPGKYAWDNLVWNREHPDGDY